MADTLHLTRNLNRRWDQQRAKTRLTELGIPLLALSLILPVGAVWLIRAKAA